MIYTVHICTYIIIIHISIICNNFFDVQQKIVLVCNKKNNKHKKPEIKEIKVFILIIIIKCKCIYLYSK